MQSQVFEFDIPMSPDVDLDKIRKIENLKDGFVEIEQKLKSLTEYSLRDAISELGTFA